MRIDRVQIEAHARQRLQGEAAGADPRGHLSHFKRFLKLETDRLRMRHRFGLGGLEIASARSCQVDQVVADDPAARRGGGAPLRCPDRYQGVNRS